MQGVTTRVQPHLGKIAESYKPQDAMGGYMALAKVIKVHHKHGTVDVQIVKTNNVVSSSSENEGKYGVRVGTSTAHYNGITLSSSGVVEPIQEGQWVVLAYLDNSKSEPIILCSFHNTWENSHNILHSNYPLNPEESNDDYREALKYLRVFPSQSYLRVDGIGALEYSHPSGTFFSIEPDMGDRKCLGDGHNEYGHSDLHEKDPMTGQTRGAKTEDALFPVNMLLQHRCVGDIFIKLFFDRFGSIRNTRDANDGTLTFWEMNDKGGYSIARQLDSVNHHAGVNKATVDISEKGSITLARVQSDMTSRIKLDSMGDIDCSVESSSKKSGVRLTRSEGVTLYVGNTKIVIDNKENIQVLHPSATISVDTSGVAVSSTKEVQLTQDSGSYLHMTNNGNILIHASRKVLITQGEQ